MIGLGPVFFSLAGRFFRLRRRDAVVHEIVDRAHASLSSLGDIENGELPANLDA